MDKCDRCLWAGCCCTAMEECPDFTTMDENEYIEEYHRVRAEELLPYWIVYIEQYGDD